LNKPLNFFVLNVEETCDYYSKQSDFVHDKKGKPLHRFTFKGVHELEYYRDVN